MTQGNGARLGRTRTSDAWWPLSVQRWLWCGAALLSLLCPSTVAGQNIGQAVAPAVAGPGRNLIFTASLTGGYNRNVIPNSSQSTTVGGTSASFLQGNNTHLGGSAHLFYELRTSRSTLGVSFGSAFRVYRTSTGPLYPVSHAVGIGYSRDLAQHLSVQFNGASTYTPQYQSSALTTTAATALGQVLPPSFDDSISSNGAFSYSTSGGLNYRPTKRSSFDLSYNYTRLVYSGQGIDTTRYRAGGGYRRSITKDLSFHAGYRLQESTYSGAAANGISPVHVHNVDLGLDYSRAFRLSLTNKTTFSFNLGSALVDTNGRFRLHALGNADLHQQLTRSWSLDIGYNRSVYFIDGVTDPILADTVNADVGGPLARRLSFRGGASYTKGSVGVIPGTGAGYGSYRASARLQMPVTQELQAFVGYFYFHNAFGSGVALLPGTTPRLDRQSVQGGLTLTLPLLGTRPGRG